MEYQFDQNSVEMIDIKGVDIAFRKDGREYHTEGEANHSCNPAGMQQTYEQVLICVGDDDFEGMLYFDIVNESCEDEAEACDWDKFEVWSY
ncbi:MAG: hypothetical protein IBX50_12440 [Marinospirillum sp.]|uniref:hypothetical protein n=1 Tax=Marinospirillum sp. TaxID=2183934 RepID=UPI0019F79029|nr:hypothetical protein [Marinospirillum sp.]MBE0507505.1 hypothetical protein [Marinospirillum sp.]